MRGKGGEGREGGREGGEGGEGGREGGKELGGGWRTKGKEE